MPDEKKPPNRHAAMLAAFAQGEPPLEEAPTPEIETGLKGAVLRALLRFNTANNVELRRKQVDQYLGDDPNALPDAPYRPSSLTRFQDRPFKSQQKYLPHAIELPDEVIGKRLDELTLPHKLSTPPSVALANPLGGIRGSSASVPLYMGLGRGTTSIGKDEAGKPFLSIFDAWDFEGDDPMWKILQRLGRPFNVYDRVPIPLEGGVIPRYVRTIPSNQPDIELPAK